METKYYLYESKYNDYSEFWITTRMYDGKKLKPVAQAGTIPELETVANATNNFAAVYYEPCLLDGDGTRKAIPELSLNNVYEVKGETVARYNVRLPKEAKTLRKFAKAYKAALYILFETTGDEHEMNASAIGYDETVIAQTKVPLAAPTGYTICTGYAPAGETTETTEMPAMHNIPPEMRKELAATVEELLRHCANKPYSGADSPRGYRRTAHTGKRPPRALYAPVKGIAGVWCNTDGIGTGGHTVQTHICRGAPRTNSISTKNRVP